LFNSPLKKKKLARDGKLKREKLVSKEEEVTPVGFSSSLNSTV